MKGIPMQTGVLRVLRATAASWWRHKELRRTGQSARARQLERKAILGDLGYLRQVATLPNAHVICGEGGTFIHLGWTTYIDMVEGLGARIVNNPRPRQSA
ncbi:hypothetical protein M8756_20010 [Lutimaribacter sp. EGI FJ00015]|uniref:Uncharacterized protein n=1 Tax=Lutimaribacter degradans TaxID=2945989 RepID=A0ACC6A0S9_9RHOB|nr:hypothetical protein [Lutimaribacter sp. EGI FJ00013]MCM2563970.1 hypothetical protein [Lutimaribacter sp. EGI FJ00013]MCO0615553.1 hypothetical protein [Lutimaribacter sp. EGI FJ00015]MCO0637955.1 hypothetical protein [Lutimaribacter sp. EGI FJ00014]